MEPMSADCNMDYAKIKSSNKNSKLLRKFEFKNSLTQVILTQTRTFDIKKD